MRASENITFSFRHIAGTIFLLVFFVFVGNNLYGQSVDELVALRTMSDEAEKSKEEAQEFADLMKSKPVEKPIYIGYKALSKFLLAKHVTNPAKKIEKFNSGKVLLENALELQPTNVELRYIRFATQTNTPSILKYKDNIAIDKKFILRFLAEKPHLIDTHLFERVRDFMLNSSACLQEEKNNLKQLN